jgi:aspartate aminotransferase
MLSQRALKLKPSPTLALAAKAKELAAQGKDVISLSVGEPDWDTYGVVKAAAIQAIEEGMTKYTPAAGIPELRKAIARQVNGDLGQNYSFQQATVTAGAKFIVFSALQMICDPGDEVIIPAPYWVSYPTMVELADAVPVIVTPETGNKITGTALRSAITDKTKALILNSPSNPTGDMYSVQELSELAVVLREYPKLVVLSDDIYNRLVFNERGLAPHLLEVAPDLVDRVVLINGASKSYSMTGWRIGWALGPEQLIRAMSDYQSQSVSCASGFSQKAAIVAIEQGDTLLVESRQLLRARRDFAFERLTKMSGVRCALPEGAFYIWPDVSFYFGKKWDGQEIRDSRDFARCFLDAYNVAAVPGYEFGADPFIRISYALGQERMAEALNRLEKFLSEIH